MKSLLNAGVMQGMVKANSYVKATDVAMKVFYDARHRGDKAVMERSRICAQDAMKRAGESSEEAKKALKEAKKEVKEEIKAEQEAALEKRRQEAAERRKEQQEVAKGSKIAVDTVEISHTRSKEGQTMVDGKAQTEKPKDTRVNAEETVENADVSVESVKVPVKKGVYTAHGNVNPVSADPKMSVTA